ncbi:potassium channel family protein [Kitasatospora sp. P5_F3]
MESPERGAGGGWLRLLAVAGAVALAVGYFTIPMGHFGPEHPVLSWTAFGVALAVLALLLLWQVGWVLSPLERGHPAVVILVLVYLSLILFSMTYLAMSRQAGEFNGLGTRVDALYFTLVTVSTVGYGDITATGQSARVVVMVQIVFNLLILTAAASAFSQQMRGRMAARTQRASGAVRPEDGAAGDSR